MNKRLSFLLSLAVVFLLFSACKGVVKDANKPSSNPTEEPQKEGNFKVGEVMVEMEKIEKIDEIILGHAHFDDNKPHKVALDAYLWVNMRLLKNCLTVFGERLIIGTLQLKERLHQLRVKCRNFDLPIMLRGLRLLLFAICLPLK